jgi:predicted O-linked N-acetylglucosamine transferase (SPINDLY family)
MSGNPSEAAAEAIATAAAHLTAGRFGAAEPLLRGFLDRQPAHFDALQLLGIVEAQKGDLAEAVNLFRRALAIHSGQAVVHQNLAKALQGLGRPAEALEAYENALRLQPANLEALLRRGNLLHSLKRHREAIEAFEALLRLKPDSAEALNNRGNAWKELGALEQALASYEEALQLLPDNGIVQCNRAGVLLDLRRFEEAEAAFAAVLALDPASARAWAGLGKVWLAEQRTEEALAAFQHSLELEPEQAEVLRGQGDALMLAKQYSAGAASYERAMELDPADLSGLGAACIGRLQVADWSRLERQRAAIREGVAYGRSVCSPWIFLCLSDCAAEQLACARIHGLARHPATAAPLWSGETYRHTRLRIAYLSADFHNHATAVLMAELFELHSRDAFEWWGISYGPRKEGPMRARLEAAFDHFLEVSGRSDREVAEQLRALEIDIAVDLKGYTRHGRPGILAHRPAPLLVNYLGYPGSLGLPFVDVILADPVLIPPEHEPFYSETVVRLPHCYQPNDRGRAIAARVPERSELGLPERGFVFCCFNNTYKILPEIFTIWMRLLRAVEGSVLWLLAESDEASVNLRREAEARGVAGERVVFAPRAPLDQHLARHRQADLFLDTLPYGAHTTASDALWAGLPLLTCLGASFQGRVAASLLTTLGLPDLICPDLPTYEQRALDLAQDSDRLEALRRRLCELRATSPLFDTDRFRRDLENAYRRMHQG